jgi:predicted RNase H-like HicB family nuclease
MRYSMLIQWSEEDQLYIVSLPEFGQYARTHGKTYEQALEMGKDCLEELIASYEETGEPLPEPRLFPSDLLQAA